MIVTVVSAIIAVVVGFLIGQFTYKQVSEKKLDAAHKSAKDILSDAEKQAENALKEANLEAKEKGNAYRLQVEKELKKRRLEVQKQEDRLLKREETLDRKDSAFEKRDNSLERQEEKLEKEKQELTKKQQKADSLIEKRQQEVARVSNLTKEEARTMVIDETKQELADTRAQMIKESYDSAKEASAKDAKNLIVEALQQSSADIVSETTVSVVTLPNDDMKGRIIGREGRNIRTFESLTGIDLIIDDTPNAVVLSGFNPVRREVAKMALEKLIKDGRIHPARIEEMVDKSKKELEAQIQETGENVVFDLGIHSMNPDLIKLIGQLKYKISYGQNVLSRSIQVAKLAGVFAAELGEDVTLAKRAGLLREIGLSSNSGTDVSYIDAGVDIAKKYGESPEVIDAIQLGGPESEPHYMISELVDVANKISMARPGAKSDSLESFVHRLDKLEKISNSFDEVSKSYAVQAGREIRVIAKPEKISDTQAIVLARDIKDKIEKEMNHPGHVKVDVIREVRSVEYAK
ncbi:ribonuclease Y [Fructilactobacillus fructivorans]|uniref:Ribonuclease Y n=1 Tax=Fructilactobacillus fructivorans TaxID=1614 RepID=A0A0C1Q131_9LACO|nr:ribonuclease Y [Fructilactobacillus fructivorans]KID41563.1 Hydrolase (HAD superfamily) [Fructilactobacillus fructivorans]MCT0151214.1 ribonuclease Y [Fructilactobacillus fructivorans]MCT2867709.1 ribonuclease Y [Fructilactobacillus fructivorans]MCT2868773.1 ribonuclease Y [Fructilactobacillus fructivorans]MCT2874057.1 ribonuclease Y [Fructilactobacillus fructivorans]